MNYRDKIQKLSNAQILIKINLADSVVADGIKELAGESALKRVIRQRDELVAVIKDRDRKKKKKPEGVVIGMKSLNIHSRRL